MSDANEALANVRGWLCDNLSDGDAGEVCGMLSTVSWHVNTLESENDKLRNFANRLWILLSRNEPCFVWKGMVDEARELGIEVDDE